MRGNAGLSEAQAGVKNASRNNNNLRYADDTNLMAESRGTKEPLDEGERESEKAGLKLNIPNETSCTLISFSWFPLLPNMDNHQFCFVSINIPTLDIAYIWNHTVAILFCMASFTEHIY